MSVILPGRLWMCGDYEVNSQCERPTLVVDCTREGGHFTPDPAWTAIEHFPFDDGEDIPAGTRFEALLTRILGCIEAGQKVVVHCNAGLNRSGLVTALVLCRFMNWTAEKSIEYIRVARHPMALCNAHFVTFLKGAYP